MSSLEGRRDGGGHAWLQGISLDLRLGGRMLVKYPGVTIVGACVVPTRRALRVEPTVALRVD